LFRLFSQLRTKLVIVDHFSFTIEMITSKFDRPPVPSY